MFLVALAGLLAVWLGLSSLRAVQVDELLPNDGDVVLVLYEQDAMVPLNQLRLAVNDQTRQAVRSALEDARPRWNGRRRDLSKDSFCVELVSTASTARISVSGQILITFADGEKRFAATPRSARLYDHLADIIHSAGKSE